MNSVTAQMGTIKAQLLVRDKATGNVVFDDWFNIHPDHHSDLSKEDWDYIKQKQMESK